jgi:hypothetical protein
MNHTTLQRIVAISLVAAMTTIGLAVLSPAKVMAQGNGPPIIPPGQLKKITRDLLTANSLTNLDNGAYQIKTNPGNGKITITGPNDLKIEQDRSFTGDLADSIADLVGGNTRSDSSSANSGS